jgi:hypothetical protein
VSAGATRPRDGAAETHAGTCFCGAVAIEARGAPLEMGYCHCRSCRQHSGAPVSAYLLWKAEDVRVTRGAALVGRFQRSAMSERRFCTRCGGQLATHHPALGLTDVRPAVLPGVAFEPAVHLNYAETVLPLKDGLPKLRDFPAAVGGSGTHLPE